MRCQHAHELISRALDETLSEYDRQSLASHLQQCPGCARHEHALARGHELLSRSQVDPPENFEWKVQLAIQKALRAGAREQLAPRARRFWLPLGLSAAAVAVVVVMAGMVWLGSWTSQPQDPYRQGSTLAQVGDADLDDAQPVSLPQLPIVGRPGFTQMVSGPPGTGFAPFSQRFDQIVFGEQDPLILHSRIDRLQMEVLRLQRENAFLRMQLGSGHSAGADSEAYLKVKTVREP